MEYTDPECVFIIFYIIFSFCFIFPTTEFLALGLSVESIFKSVLGSEDNFIHYHLRRTCLTAVTHSVLPFVGMYGLLNINPDIDSWDNLSCYVKLLYFVSFAVPVLTTLVVYQWHKKKWSRHPLIKNLMCFATNNEELSRLIVDIAYENMQLDKLQISCGTTSRIIATENWLISVTPYTVHIAHLSDVELIVYSSDTHVYSADGPLGSQFINIKVKSDRRGLQPFDIRINSMDFRDLQNKIIRPIKAIRGVQFHKSLTERFLDEFKAQVELNPLVFSDEEIDVCIGCMSQIPNVKLKKCCLDSEDAPSEQCSSCFCRPMWCVDCMGKWFASRQDPETPGTWLSSKCPCPMCRKKFCVLDVCYLERGR